MPARFHDDLSEIISEHEVRFSTHPDEINGVCRYCSAQIIWEEIEEYWNVSGDKILEYHRETIESLVEYQGEILYDDLEFLNEPYVENWFGFCPACGWWIVDKKVHCESPHNFWDIHFGAAGGLKKLDLSDISLPLAEIRSYLAARYESRFEIHPRKFEEVVASVFRSLGYQAQVTAYSNDGGIDAVLTNSLGSTIGVQVKRSKNRIKVEQIRAFLGALTIAGHLDGVFVTTSSFQPGAKICANAATATGTPIRLVDAERFFELLRFAQIRDSDGVRATIERLKKKALELQPIFEWHLGSL